MKDFNSVVVTLPPILPVGLDLIQQPGKVADPNTEGK